MEPNIQEQEKKVRTLELEKALLFDEINDSLQKVGNSSEIHTQLQEKFYKFGITQHTLMIEKRELLKLTQNIISDEP